MAKKTYDFRWYLSIQQHTVSNARARHADMYLSRNITPSVVKIFDERGTEAEPRSPLQMRRCIVSMRTDRVAARPARRPRTLSGDRGSAAGDTRCGRWSRASRRS